MRYLVIVYLWKPTNKAIRASVGHIEGISVHLFRDMNAFYSVSYLVATSTSVWPVWLTSPAGFTQTSAFSGFFPLQFAMVCVFIEDCNQINRKKKLWFQQSNTIIQ